MIKSCNKIAFRGNSSNAMSEKVSSDKIIFIVVRIPDERIVSCGKGKYPEMSLSLINKMKLTKIGS